MEHPQSHPEEALRQRFRDLTEALHHIHASWEEAHRQHDLARQRDLIDREHGLLDELHEVLAAFQEHLRWRQASLGPLPEAKP